MRWEGDAHSKQKVPGFSQRQGTDPLRKPDAASSLDPEHSDQHGDLAATSHKARPDMSVRPAASDQASALQKIQKTRQIFFSHISSAAEVK